MHEYREALYRMRRGERDRQISRDGVMGRNKLARLRSVAEQERWLDPGTALPPEAELLQALRARQQAQSAQIVKPPSSSVEPFAGLIEQWHAQGVQGVAIHAALVRNHGFAGHYSSVRRFLGKLKGQRVDATMILDFAPGEAAQVDFGAGPMLVDPARRAAAHLGLRHDAVLSAPPVRRVRLGPEVATWLGCHRRAFEWFGGVPARV